MLSRPHFLTICDPWSNELKGNCTVERNHCSQGTMGEDDASDAEQDCTDILYRYTGDQMDDDVICGSLFKNKGNETLAKVRLLMSSFINVIIILDVERSPTFLHVRPLFIQFFLCSLPDPLPSGSSWTDNDNLTTILCLDQGTEHWPLKSAYWQDVENPRAVNPSHQTLLAVWIRNSRILDCNDEDFWLLSSPVRFRNQPEEWF